MAEPAVAVWPSRQRPRRRAGRSCRSATHLVDIEPEAVGRDLRERGQGALPHVDRARFDRAAAVPRAPPAPPQRTSGSGNGGSHAPADEEAVLVAHLPGRARPARPAESLGPWRSIRAAPSTNRACRLSVRPPHNSRAGSRAGPCRKPPPLRRWRPRAPPIRRRGPARAWAPACRCRCERPRGSWRWPDSRRACARRRPRFDEIVEAARRRIA